MTRKRETSKLYFLPNLLSDTLNSIFHNTDNEIIIGEKASMLFDQLENRFYYEQKLSKSKDLNIF